MTNEDRELLKSLHKRLDQQEQSMSDLVSGIKSHIDKSNAAQMAAIDEKIDNMTNMLAQVDLDNSKDIIESVCTNATAIIDTNLKISSEFYKSLRYAIHDVNENSNEQILRSSEFLSDTILKGTKATFEAMTMIADKQK